MQTKKATVYRHVYCTAAMAGILAAALGASLLLAHIGVAKENLLMLFLIGVLLTAVTTRGYIYGVVSSVLSVFLLNFFFTVPYHTFIISNEQDFLLLLFFLLAALISGFVSSKLRQQTLAAQQNEQTAAIMYETVEQFLNLTGVGNIVQNALSCVYERTRCSCRIVLNEADPETGQSVFYSAGADETTCDWAHAKTLSIHGLTRDLGTLLIDEKEPLSSDTDKIVRATAYQTALVLDREYIYHEREKIRIAMESEQVKSTLLRSISHDIRTPLTGIIGASNVLLENGETFLWPNIKKLAGDIREEAEWLMMTVQNILNMTRISEGRLQINAEFESADDLIEQTLSRLPLSFDTERLSVEMPEKICLVNVDGNLFVQALLNLIDNAFKHAGPGAHVTLGAREEAGALLFFVKDDGCGIDEALLPQIFEGFVTKSTHEADKGRGVGLGLSICRAIIEAHGGTIHAENRKEGGAEFILRMPCEVQES